jgi:transposase
MGYNKAVGEDTLNPRRPNIMISIGIDHHKKYCQVVAVRENGELVWEGQVPTRYEGLARLKEELPPGEPVQSVLESGRGWGAAYDALEDLGLNPILANPYRTRLIADSYIKTDKIDAAAHALLLRIGITPKVHVPSRERREQKHLLRHRLWMVNLQTRIKNRIHDLLDRRHVDVPAKSDLFGAMGTAWLKALVLSGPDQHLLTSHLTLLEEIRQQIRQTEKWIDQALKDHPLRALMETFPGIAKILGALIALEIDTIDRFPSAARLCSYSGLVCSTYSSGGKTVHGGLIPTCNRYLRYAFVEASWTAIKVSPYFRSLYGRLRTRKIPSVAIVAVARRLCEIAYACLKNRRPYEERPYRFRGRAALSHP